MDSNAASQMMEKLWTDWFAMMGNAQAQAAAAMRPPDAGERNDGDAAAPTPGAPGAATGPPPFLTPDVMRQFQKAFLDSLSKYCDDYMRSPQFLSMMKQSLDNSLTFRQQLNEFLGRATTTGFAPTGGMQVDQAVIVDAVRETERKLRDLIDALSARLDRLETRLDGRSGT